MSATTAQLSPPLQMPSPPVPPAEYSDPRVLHPAEADNLLRGAPWRRFAVLGDSIAEGLGEPALGYTDAPWADRVALALDRAAGYPVDYLNLGRRHLTAHEILDTQLAPALRWAPDLVAVIAGGNDMLAKDFDPDDTAFALDEIFASLRAQDADVVTFTLMDPTHHFDHTGQLSRRIALLNAAIRDIASRSGVIVTDLAARPYSNDRAIYSADLLHANMRGHAIVASATIERIGELVRNREGVL